jgi:hypothetical protein
MGVYVALLWRPYSGFQASCHMSHIPMFIRYCDDRLFWLHYFNFEELGGRYTHHTHRQQVHLISFLLFIFQNMEISVTMDCVPSRITRHIIMKFLATRSEWKSAIFVNLLVNHSRLAYLLGHLLTLWLSLNLGLPYARCPFCSHPPPNVNFLNINI